MFVLFITASHPSSVWPVTLLTNDSYAGLPAATGGWTHGEGQGVLPWGRDYSDKAGCWGVGKGGDILSRWDPLSLLLKWCPWEKQGKNIRPSGYLLLLVGGLWVLGVNPWVKRKRVRGGVRRRVQAPLFQAKKKRRGMWRKQGSRNPGLLWKGMVASNWGSPVPVPKTPLSSRKHKHSLHGDPRVTLVVTSCPYTLGDETVLTWNWLKQWREQVLLSFSTPLCFASPFYPTP